MPRFTTETASEAGRKSAARLSAEARVERTTELGMRTLKRYGVGFYSAIRAVRTKRSTRIVDKCKCKKCEALRASVNAT